MDNFFYHLLLHKAIFFERCCIKQFRYEAGLYLFLLELVSIFPCPVLVGLTCQWLRLWYRVPSHGWQCYKLVLSPRHQLIVKMCVMVVLPCVNWSHHNCCFSNEHIKWRGLMNVSFECNLYVSSCSVLKPRYHWRVVICILLCVLWISASWNELSRIIFSGCWPVMPLLAIQWNS